MYRLIASDFDGTIRSFTGYMDPAVPQTMQAAIDQGAWVTIATSRGYQNVRPFLQVVRINAPVICGNGALIVEPFTERVLYSQPTPVDLIQEALKLCMEHGWGAVVDLADMELALRRAPGSLHFGVYRLQELVRWAPDPCVEIREPPTRIIILLAAPEERPRAIELLKEVCGERARVISSSPTWVELVPPGISKSQGLAHVADFLGVAREETIAIGDSENDIDMLEWAGLGVAMGNAIPEALAVAGWVAPTVEEGGVAEVLRRFVLSNGGGRQAVSNSF